VYLGSSLVDKGERFTIGRPSVTPPTVFRRGEVTPPTIGRPLVVSSTVFRRLEEEELAKVAQVDIAGLEMRGNSPSKKTATTAVVVAVAAASEKSCHFDIEDKFKRVWLV
jgi:hypothetical protein